MTKKMTTIRIDPIILKRAQELGLNISKVSENAIIACIDALEGQKDKTVFGEAFSREKGSWCGRRDLNPGRQRGRLMS